jgi:hypothetical protein
MTRAAAALALALLAACGGGTERERVTNVMVPPEEQRADLLRARDLGIIDDAELARQLQKIGR